MKGPPSTPCDAMRTAQCTVSDSTVRVLCLGNDLLADDAFGGVVAAQLARSAAPSTEVMFTANTGFGLIDFLLNTRRLVVVDTVQTGEMEPGSVLVLREGDVGSTAGGSPHYIGLFEALALARKLGLPAADEVVIVAVEAADCTTVGGRISPAVRAAVPDVLELLQDMTASDVPQGS